MQNIKDVLFGKHEGKVPQNDFGGMNGHCQAKWAKKNQINHLFETVERISVKAGNKIYATKSSSCCYFSVRFVIGLLV